MRARSFTVLAAAGIAAAALGQAWKPGGEYSGSGVRTNATYDPFLGNILPWSANVQVVGRIATNDVAVFTDRSGRYVRGTNFIGMVEAAASNAAAAAGYATTGQVAAAAAAITANLQAEIAGSTGTLVRAESTNGWQVGAHQAWLTNETDAAAMRLYHYGSPDIVESPTNWFKFNAGTITAFNWEDGRTNVVIPWAIGGVAVTNVGALAFYDSDTLNGYPVVSVTAPQTLKTIGSGAIRSCSSLASVSFPQVTTIGDGALAGCISLASVSLGQDAPDEAANVLANTPATVYVTNPQAIGWGETWNGAPVVRPPLYADSVTVAGTSVVTRISDAVADHVTGGVHTNVTLAGTVTFFNTQPTNLTARLFVSNDVVMVEWINQ